MNHKAVTSQIAVKIVYVYQYFIFCDISLNNKLYSTKQLKLIININAMKRVIFFMYGTKAI